VDRVDRVERVERVDRVVELGLGRTTPMSLRLRMPLATALRVGDGGQMA
jgi:hypothetical protein